jgi:serine phosphatase RsbU (regulator of sigma subunit)
MKSNQPLEIGKHFINIYIAGALLVFILIMMESLFIKDLTIDFLIKFSLPVSAIILLIMVFLMLSFTYIRLRSYWNSNETLSTNTMRSRLLRFPMEAYALITIYGVILIPIYHIVHYVSSGHSLTNVTDPFLYNFIRSYLYELSIVMAIAVFYYAHTRRIIRPMLLQLPMVEHAPYRTKSLIRIFIVTFSSLLLMTILMMMWYIMEKQAQHRSIEFVEFGVLIAIELIFSIYIFLLLAREYHSDLRVIIHKLRSVHTDAVVTSQMPILSNDEIGQLAHIINQQQNKLKDEYRLVQSQFEWARKVQLKLLPNLKKLNSNHHVEAITVPRKEICSGFYDVIELPNQQRAYVVGDTIGEGLPGALFMSAALVLLRTEIHSGGCAMDIIQRVSSQLHSNVQAMAISLALVIIDQDCRLVDYFLTGEISAYIVNPQGITTLSNEVHRLKLDQIQRITIYSSACGPAIGLHNMEKFQTWALTHRDSHVELLTDLTMLTVQLNPTVRSERDEQA